MTSKPHDERQMVAEIFSTTCNHMYLHLGDVKTGGAVKRRKWKRERQRDEMFGWICLPVTGHGDMDNELPIYRRTDWIRFESYQTVNHMFCAHFFYVLFH